MRHPAENPDLSETAHPPSQAKTIDSGPEVIAVLEERLKVLKQVVDSGGGVRIRKVVHEEAITVEEPLAIDTLEVKRVSVNRDVESPVPIRYEGDITILPVVEERLITRKQLVLLEEIHVSKVRRVERSSREITLRREEVIIERQDPTSGEWKPFSTTNEGTDAPALT
jgi:uncharacterized protein (TIGR02271 family)